MLPCGTSRLAAVLSGGTQVPSIATSPFEHIRSDGSAMAVGAEIMANTADAEPAAAAKSRAVRDLGTRITQNQQVARLLEPLHRRRLHKNVVEGDGAEFAVPDQVDAVAVGVRHGRVVQMGDH